MAANIVWTGVQLLRRSAAGPDGCRTAGRRSMRRWCRCWNSYRAQGLDYHALRTRQAGARQFVSVHVLVPGEWSVARGHDLVETIEAEIGSRAAARHRVSPTWSRSRIQPRGMMSASIAMKRRRRPRSGESRP
ncbi:MAG: hypothetical protein MZW92_76890 [Comamonadaceae bacterium]|nr:hypothetical protein [Comamonadaceae bacterium]